MKTLYVILTHLAVSLSAMAGGPSLYSNDLGVSGILVFPDRILMQVNGTIELFTAKTPAEGTDNGNAKTVSLVVDKAVLEIPRKRWKHPGGDEFEIYTDWDAYCADIWQWEGEAVTAQMWSTELILVDGQVRKIVAEQCKLFYKRREE